jgi:hypothetical protein
MRQRQGRRDRYHGWLEESSVPARPRRRGWSWRRTVLVTFVIVFGLLVLPHFTIAGHHWHLFFL